MSTADRMAVLDQGVVQQVGTPAELYDRPVNAFVAGFVGTMNVLPATVVSRDAGRVVAQIDGVGAVTLDDAGDMPTANTANAATALASFRPHALRIAAVDAVRDTVGSWMAGTVEATEFLGDFTRYRVRAGAHALTVDQPHLPALPAYAPGDAVSLALDPARVRLLPA